MGEACGGNVWGMKFSISIKVLISKDNVAEGDVGGGGGIRTHGGREPTPVFKTGAFDHSATPPRFASLNGGK